jgi:hypothetical protein
MSAITIVRTIEAALRNGVIMPLLRATNGSVVSGSPPNFGAAMRSLTGERAILGNRRVAIIGSRLTAISS